MLDDEGHENGQRDQKGEVDVDSRHIPVQGVGRTVSGVGQR